ncbi:larval cuticle protein 65Ag1-like [Pollicipes pollicipes]|uniref:larval cuticle protein 65Ag1-like n=1 Tax=Pollicipes pollicipes TaxID=41117 RepID=UPI00188551DD|nr:larval cuticle protein 65Ag1-like isoform X2 [Pollicipes pollicipes]XP_037080400.1 larval cuticle protein 65Ag1-like [Pollicipes pollicipes]XP_037080462.1 larval cuticle protein 65Ag1-like [Pollicipes pollicipes]
MKFVLLAAVLLASAAARPQDAILPEVISSRHMQNEDGSFAYGYEQTDGQVVDVQGEQRQIGDEVGTVMSGSYSFVGLDGVVYTVTWTADENGFRATGDHLPRSV